MSKKINKPVSNREWRKRLKFVLKILLYAAALFAIHKFYDQLVDFGIAPNFIKALRLYLYADVWISFFRLVIVFVHQKKHQLSRDVKNNFIVGINHIANILHTFVIIGSILLLFDIEPIRLITSLSIVAAAIAILSKDYISNMINGMIMMFSDELTIGDEIKIGDVKGKIQDITLVNVHIVNDDEDLIYIPNTLIFNSQIFNYTKRSIRKISFDFDLKNEFATDIAKVEEYIKEALKDYSQFIKEDSYLLRIIKINENFTSLKFQFVLHRQSSVREKDMRRVALREVLKYIGESRN